MNEELKTEDQRYAGLTTAALASAGAATAVATDEQAEQLLSPNEAKEFRVRWDTIQGAFVDEPRRAVEQADSLVAGAMKRLAEVFADERAKLEGAVGPRRERIDRGFAACAAPLSVVFRPSSFGLGDFRPEPKWKGRDVCVGLFSVCPSPY